MAKCIKETGNWSQLKTEHRIDNAAFSPEKFKADLKISGPKLMALIDNIRALDEADFRKTGHYFKHFIYSDIKSPYGAKLIASALAAHGYHHAYSPNKSKSSLTIDSPETLAQTKGNNFATLTSVQFFERPLGVRFRRELLGRFNERPLNIHGDQIRLIILDSGFREGVDLFDIKYAHIFEPITTANDQKQVIGRATRFCGQRGLEFSKKGEKGWPVNVFRYETLLTKDVQSFIMKAQPELLTKEQNSFFQLFLKFSNIDPRKITFANELEQAVIQGAVDRSLTRSIHKFSQFEDEVLSQSGGKSNSSSSYSQSQEHDRAELEKMRRAAWEKYAKINRHPFEKDRIAARARAAEEHKERMEHYRAQLEERRKQEAIDFQRQIVELREAQAAADKAEREKREKESAERKIEDERIQKEIDEMKRVEDAAASIRRRREQSDLDRRQAEESAARQLEKNRQDRIRERDELRRKEQERRDREAAAERKIEEDRLEWELERQASAKRKEEIEERAREASAERKDIERREREASAERKDIERREAERKDRVASAERRKAVEQREREIEKEKREVEKRERAISAERKEVEKREKKAAAKRKQDEEKKQKEQEQEQERNEREKQEKQEKQERQEREKQEKQEKDKNRPPPPPSSMLATLNGRAARMEQYIQDYYVPEYEWAPAKIENGCEHSPVTMDFSATQNFLRNFLTVETPFHGSLAFHSVGTGKCHGLNTPIMMFDGSIKMVQDVLENDLLMGDDSTPRRVISLARGRDTMYQIVPKHEQFGDIYTANSEHILCLKNHGVQKRALLRERAHQGFADGRAGLGGQITEISVTDYMGLSLEKQSLLSGYHVKVEFEGDRSNVLFNPYKIGAWLVGQNVFPENIHTLREIQKYNLLTNKHIPHEYKTSCRVNRRELLRGIMDANDKNNKLNKNNINDKNNKGVDDFDEYIINAPSEVLAADIIFLCRSIGFSAYSTRVISTISTSSNSFEIHVMANEEDRIKNTIEIRSIGEGDYYGFILDGNNRYLLGDFTVTHNTCAAIATATTTFEPAGWTIVYVTKHTLKADVWKNMFEKSCSLIIQERIRQGLVMPDDISARMKLLSKSWSAIQPMSYRQFSNMLDDKSALHEKLVKINGSNDILKKTLIIIDEAHKLFAPDVTGVEKPDIDVIRSAIQHSYVTSGKEACKLLLMTGTPYTDDPMDMMRLLNLLLDPAAQFPEEFEVFASKYLDLSGAFTHEGRHHFKDAVAGLVSYLNREKDIRTFAYPVIKDIRVPMSAYEEDEELDNLMENIKRTNDVVLEYEALKSVIARAIRKLAKHKATKNVAIDAEFKRLENEKKKTDGNEQKLPYKECKDSVKITSKESVNAVKMKGKTALQDLNAECMKLDAPARKECKADAKADIASKTKEAVDELKLAEKTALKDCDKLKANKDDIAANKKPLADQKAAQKAVIAEEFKREKELLNIPLEAKMKWVTEFKKRGQEFRKKLGEAEKTDRSQQKALDECLTGIVPAAMKSYKQGKMADDVGLGSRESIVPSEERPSIYLISGHGEERAPPFKNRQQLPTGYTLVLLSKCFTTLTIDIGCRMYSVFSDPANMAQLDDPLTYKEELEKLLDAPIRVYQATDYVPTLFNNMFANIDKHKAALLKSGVFQVPNIPVLPSVLNAREARILNVRGCEQYATIIKSPAHYSKTVHKAIFDGNVYSPADQQLSYNDMIDRRFDVRDVMRRVGPGVYYYVGCRSLNSAFNPTEDEYDEIIERSDEQQARKTKEEEQ